MDDRMDDHSSAWRLTTVSRSRKRATASCPATLDIVVVLDTVKSFTPQDHDTYANHKWLQRSLADAFKDARIVTAGKVHPDESGAEPTLHTKSIVDGLLLKFLNLRLSTKTSDRPFVIVVHNTSGSNMIFKFLLSLATIIATQRDGLGLKHNLCGIMGLDNSTADDHHDEILSVNGIAPISGAGFAGSNWSTCDRDMGRRFACSIPVTFLFGNSNVRDEAIQEYVHVFPRCTNMFSPLDEKSYPSTYASERRVFGELRKLLAPSISIDKSHVAVEGARVRSWLSPSKALFEYDTPRATTDTAEWLLQNESYTSWLSSNRDEIFWITGKPGSGKSTLMKFLVSGIRKNTLAFPQRSIVAAIFFDFHYTWAEKRDNARGQLIRVLLYQLLENEPMVLLSLRYYLNSVSPMPERPEDLDDQLYERCLQAALSMASKRAAVYLVLDALDECAPELLNDLMACIKPSHSTAGQQSPVRIIVTSRSGGTMPNLRKEYPSRLIYMEEGNSKAIADYCLTSLWTNLVDTSSLLSGHPSVLYTGSRQSLQTLVDAIAHRANGVFLWVKLVMDILVNKSSKQQSLVDRMETWHDALQDIPTELDLVYAFMLDQIPSELATVARVVLAWCVFAARPLTVDELHAALGHEGQQTEHVCMEIHSARKGSHLECISQGLLEIVYDPLAHTEGVRLIHQSAKEYLLTHEVLMPPGSAHSAISRICSGVLDVSAIPGQDKDPLLDYSSVYWAYHAETGDTLGEPQLYLSNWLTGVCLEQKDLFWYAYHSAGAGSPPKCSRPISMLHIAAKFGLRNTIEALSDQILRMMPWSQVDGLGSTALHHACEGNHPKTVALLLNSGSDVNAVNHGGHTPLHLAVIRRNRHVARLLIDRGADVDPSSATLETPLHLAARMGMLDIVEVLLKHGADPNQLDHHGNSILTLATINGHEDVAQRVLKLQDTTWPSTSFGLALVVAASLGLTGLVQSLISSGRCTTTGDIFVQEALIAACVVANEKIASMLIRSGCQPNIHDHQHGQSALAVAAASGNEQLVLLLLDSGADVNIRDVRTGDTPIMYAITHGHPIIVKLLLKHGAHLEELVPPSASAHPGWALRIVSSLFRQCPNHNKCTQSKQTLSEGHSGDRSKRRSKKSSGETRKRGRSQKLPGDNDEDSEDEPSYKRNKSTIEQVILACPFQKMYPELHDCGPYTNMNRLKEHLGRKHVKVFCDCWEVFSDEMVMRAHLRTNSCVKKDRVNYWQGISSDQEKELKRNRKSKNVTEEEHWGSVFKVIFPHFDIPPPNYVPSMVPRQGTIFGMFSNPTFQQEMTDLLNMQRPQLGDIYNLMVRHSGEHRSASDEVPIRSDRSRRINDHISATGIEPDVPTPNNSTPITQANNPYFHSMVSMIPPIPQLNHPEHGQQWTIRSEYDSGFVDLEDAPERLYGAISQTPTFRQGPNNIMAQPNFYNMNALSGGNMHTGAGLGSSMALPSRTRPLQGNDSAQGSTGVNDDAYHFGSGNPSVVENSENGGNAGYHGLRSVQGIWNVPSGQYGGNDFEDVQWSNDDRLLDPTESADLDDEGF